MKTSLTLCLLLLLTSCTSMMNHHRMKAAQRKMLATRTLQQAGQWEEALAMAERRQSSVSKSVTSSPKQKYAGETKAVPRMVDLTPLLTAWEKGPLAELKSALQKKDATRSTAAFTGLRQQCMSCHAVLGKVPAVVVSELPH
jgi:mono/diheme cytochrome c family protein